MTARVSDYKNDLYVREYANDVPPPPQDDIVKRTALAALPFFTLYQPLRAPVSIVLGASRVWNSDKNDLVGSGVAIAALAGSIFHFQAGNILTTLHDLMAEANRLRTVDDWEGASNHLIKIFSQLVYLGLICKGGLELSVLSFALQSVVNLIQSKDEFKNDRWIEGTLTLIMATVRMQQTYVQYQQLKRNWEIEAAIKKIQVGKLHGKWQFPSDHLPVGIEVNGVKIISWNVLNNAHMKFVTEKDSQGLNGSLITDLNVAVNGKGLTERDVLVADMILDMMARGDVIALQECGEPFLRHLQGRLPSNWDLIRSFKAPQKDQVALLYDKQRLTYQPTLSETALNEYADVAGRPIQNAYFTNRQGSNLRVINSHIPGDPAKPCREEFARYIHSQHTEKNVTVGLGDNNFERDEMIDAYRKAGFTEFSLHSPWKTNIDPHTKESKSIDHLFVFGEANSRDLKTEEIVKDYHLKEAIGLLK